MGELLFTNFENNPIFLHCSIRLDNIEGVKQFLQRNLFRNHYFNDNNESAASVALRYEKLEVYELLIANGITLGPQEDVENIVENASLEFREKVCAINRKYSKDSKPKYLMSFYEKSKFSYNTDKQREDIYFRTIVDAFDLLNKFKFIKAILKVCAFYNELNIYFDFNNESVEFMDPTKSKCVFGTTYIHSGYIYIGAKGLLIKGKKNIVLGTLIHELCHFALYKIYSNKSYPYYANDLEAKAKFRNIVVVSKQKAQSEPSLEPLINIVYSAGYTSDKQPAELIVRVPHLTALYSDNANKYFSVAETFFELFDFFEQHTMVDLECEYLKLQANEEVKDTNKNHGIITLIERTQTFFDKDVVLSLNIECNATDNIVQLTSNCPRLTMIYFYQLLRKQNNFDGNNIFTSMDLLKTAKTFENIVKSWNLCVKPTIFIECDGSEIDVEPLTKLLSHAGRQRIVVITKSNLDFSTEASKVEVKHTWNQLDALVQTSLIFKTIKFQGNRVPLKDMISAELYESIPLENLLSENGIVVGTEIKTSQNQIYVERKYSYPINNQIHSSESRTLNETIELAKDNKCILVSNEPGMGKTTELRRIAIKLKEKLPLSWIVFIDLKEFAKSYQKIGNVEDFDCAIKIVNYLCEKMLCLEGLESEIFTNFFNSGKIVFLTDGFDEISPTFKDFVMNLLKAIVDNSKNQLWISTRPHLEKKLVETMNPLLLKIEPFTAQNQQEYFEKFCSLRGLDKKRVDLYLDAINHIKIESSNPLITRIIAEIFEEGFDHEINDFDSYTIYKRFVDKLIARTFKKGPEYQNDLSKHLNSSQSIIDVHCKFALKIILGEKEITKEAVGLMIKDCSNFSMEEIARLGILFFDGSSHQFVHKSFAEYFVASFFIRKLFLEKHYCSDDKLKAILLCYTNVIQCWNDNQMVLNFIENGLKFYKANNEVFNNQAISKLGNILHEHENQNFLHQLLKCGCENLIAITLSSLGSRCSRNLMLAKDNGNNILMTLAKKSNLETLQKFWQFLKSNLKTNEFHNLFLEKNKNGQNVHQLGLENKNKAVRDFLVSPSVPIFEKNIVYIINQQGLLHLDRKDQEVVIFESLPAYVKSYRKKGSLIEKINHREAEDLNQDGEKLFDSKKFLEAVEKFDAAISRCPSSITTSIAKYKNKRADSLDQLGRELRKKADFEGAAVKFNAAFRTCSDGYMNKETFKENRDYAEAEILSQTGDALFNDKKYQKAVEIFDAAISKCPSGKNKSIACYKLKKADSFNYLGLESYNQEHFEDAEDLFDAAYRICPENCIKKINFKENRDHAKAEAFCKAGDMESDPKLGYKRNSLAIEKYDAAITQCPRSKTASIERYRNKKADILNQLGLRLLNRSDFTGALNKFHAAIKACVSGYYNETFFKDNMDHTEVEIRKFGQGQKFYRNTKCSAAFEKYDQSMPNK